MFNPTITIKYAVPALGGHVRIEVFDVAGRLIRVLHDDRSEPAYHAVVWHGDTVPGATAATGIYFVRLVAEGIVDTRKTSVKSHTDENFGNVRVLRFDLPEVLTGKRIDTVPLEFYVDAALKVDAAEGEVAIVDVKPLAAAYAPSEAVSVDRETAVSRHVRIGENRRVTLDITELAKSWLTGTRANYGLVIGALAGSRAGRFTLRDGTLGSGVRAKVTIFYQNRFGNRVSSQ